MADPPKPTLWIPLCYEILERDDISVSSKLVHAYLYSFLLAKQNAFPAVHTIAEHVCISERQARRAIRELEDIGALKIQRRLRPNGSQASNLFVLLVPPPPMPPAKKSNGKLLQALPGPQDPF